MASKLFIGGISYSTTEDSLRDAFAQAGNVTSVNIIVDKMTNRSKGFGFVEMATEEEAEAAKQMWDGQELDGRRLKVDNARPQQSRGRRNDY